MSVNSDKELKKSNNYIDTIKIAIKNDNFIISKNDNFNTKEIFIQNLHKQYIISDIIFSKNNKKQLLIFDLTNPKYNKDNFENYIDENISKTEINFNSKSCYKYVLKDEKITETFIICNDSISTNIKKNYLVPPYTGQNLNSKHYFPFRNKILYYYELEYNKTKYIMNLLDIKEEKINNNLFTIPKTDKTGIIK